MKIRKISGFKLKISLMFFDIILFGFYLFYRSFDPNMSQSSKIVIDIVAGYFIGISLGNLWFLLKS